MSNLKVFGIASGAAALLMWLDAVAAANGADFRSKLVPVFNGREG